MAFLLCATLAGAQSPPAGWTFTLKVAPGPQYHFTSTILFIKIPMWSHRQASAQAASRVDAVNAATASGAADHAAKLDLPTGRYRWSGPSRPWWNHDSP